MKVKKNRICAIGLVTLLSLSACAPTAPKQTTAGGKGGVLTPQVIETSKEVIEKGANPNEPIMETVFLYSANADATGLVKTMEDVEILDAQTVVDLLIQHAILEEGTTALSFDISGGEKAGPGVPAGEAGNDERIGTLNLSKIATVGTAGERVVLTAIGNTFTESFELDKLKLLIDGKNYSSGHIEQGDQDYLLYEDQYKKFN